MALKVCNGGEVKMVDAILGLSLTLRLYKNNKTPADTDVVADYTESDFVGYAPESLVSGNWVATPGDPASATYPDVVFTSTASQSQLNYGYYVTEDVGGTLMWAERWDDNDPTAPYTMVNNGDTVTWPGRFTLKDTTD